jgi:hypothetical protein
MGFLKWGAGTAVSVAGVYLVTYLAVVVLLLPVLIPFILIASVWALWPRITYRVTGHYDGGRGSGSPYRGYRDR